jgi:gluconate 5-dehydrogenase
MDTLSLFSLKGKTALITGSGSGIGYALAEGLAGAGAAILLNGRNREKLITAEQLLKQQGHNVSSLVFDVTNMDSS